MSRKVESMEDYTDGMGEVKLPYGMFLTLTNKLYGALAIQILDILQECNDLVPEELANAFGNALDETSRAAENLESTYPVMPEYYTHETGVFLACMMNLGDVASTILPYVSVTIDLDSADTINRMVTVGKVFIAKLVEGGE